MKMGCLASCESVCKSIAQKRLPNLTSLDLDFPREPVIMTVL